MSSTNSQKSKMASTNPQKSKKLLVLLIDGFRWDYFDKPGLELPGFQQLFKQGVKSEYMVPDFPSLSFPNYYSIMTGVHVQDHGVVGNFIYNKERNSRFKYTMFTEESHCSHWFEGADPLWISAVKQKKRTYMFEWPAAHVSNKDVVSTFCDAMDTSNWPSISQMEANIQKAFKLFKEDKIDMAGVYVNAVDEYGHSYGPNSTELIDMVKQTDNVIKNMMELFTADSLDDQVNIVIFSDHGMTEICESRTVDISDHIGSIDVEAVMDKGAVCSVWPKPGKTKKVYSDLKAMQNKHITVYKKEDLLDRWCYRNHQLVAPITVVADVGWYILTPEGQCIDKYKDGPARGHHGYDNAEEDMRGIFLAAGPDFKKNFKCGPVRAVDIYQVMCKALGIQPLPHKGTWSSVKDIFIH